MIKRNIDVYILPEVRCYRGFCDHQINFLQLYPHFEKWAVYSDGCIRSFVRHIFVSATPKPLDGFSQNFQGILLTSI